MSAMSAMSGPSRHRAMSMNSGRSSRGVGKQPQEYSPNMPTVQSLNFFDPCAATASMFLYAQGNSIVCCHHDTLTIERRFSRHSEEVQLLAVDNQSDLGTGRYVVSFDAGQTAIVWDLMTGDEVTRFASYEHLTVAAWLKNGNVAFGNTQGNVIQFDPRTSEHVSTRTIDQIAVTALAPSADCRTFAIGYQNGSLLVATLQPRFTILHNLSTSRAPSPIVTLAWHASSSRQKSDMLAVQAHDGDLRVWSVAKSHNAADPAKIVRVLQRTQNFVAGPNWMGWSKNGRIIQYSDSETLSWDVRTKHVTYDKIPTLQHVRGLAVYGPGASLFTLGPNNMVQQFDLNSPAIMVANVQHPANLLPPSPPVSIEEAADKSVYSSTTIHTSESESSILFDMGISESDDDHMGPFARMAQQQAPHHQAPHHQGSHHRMDSGNDMYDSTSQASSRSGFSSVSRPSAGSKTPGRYPSSLRSRGMTENTYISTGTTLRSSTVGKNRDQQRDQRGSQRDQRESQRDQQQDLDTYSMGYSIGTTSVPSVATSQSRHRPSRLRNEVPQSPGDANKVHELFPYTRARLSDIPYRHPVSNNARMTNDDLRRQMFSTIFGWNSSAEDLVRDEMARHPQGASSRILLAKWLGDINSDILAAASSENMTSSDWMLLALSGIGGQASQHKLGRAYIQRLLENGDIHAAVTIMLGMGDHNDAIEIYVSHKRYMEALILTCMAFPSVWERQSAIIKKWGEWAASHRDPQLAVRCFACTDQESTEPWTSPSAAQLTFQNIGGPSLNEVLSPNYSPGVQLGPQRSVAKASALKLITSFGDQSQKSKFFSQGDDGETPVAGAANPFNQNTAIPLDGPSYEATTAILKPSNNSRFNTPTTARGEGPSFARDRLPSIGESPLDPNRGQSHMAQLSTLQLDQVNSRLSHKRSSSGGLNHMAVGSSLQRAATAGPMMMRDGYQRVTRSGDRPPSPDAKVLMKMELIHENTRNGPRDRIPFGVNLQLRSLDQEETAEIAPAEPSAASSAARYHWPSRRRGPGSTAGSVTSVSTSGRSMRHQSSKKRDDYIHSLDTASQYSRKQRSRQASRERSRGRHDNWDRSIQSRDTSQDRGPPLSSTWTTQKHSPTSPVPMSPEDLISLSTPKFAGPAIEPLTIRKASDPKIRPSSRASSRASRRRSPDVRHRPPALDLRGRSENRDDSSRRSPSTSILPLSANHFEGSEDEEEFRAAIEQREQFRAKHCKSATRGLNTPGLSRRDRSESRHRPRADSEAVDVLAPLTFQTTRAASTDHVGDLRRVKDERQRKKEQAARDLEERRKSLLKHPQAPPIPHPTQFSPAIRFGIEASDGPNDIITRSATVPPKSMYARGTSLGLPATPKAMRLVMDDHSQMPEVPPLPPAMVQRQSTATSPEASPKQAVIAGGGNLLTLLPSTVYTPPVRPPIPRSMSAPIPDDPPSSRFRRKGSMGGLQDINEGMVSGKRRSHEEPMPPPPPPPPPPPASSMLMELQHLASPPPPPPAPLPFGQRPQGQGALASGIEIVMDDDEVSGNEHFQSYPAPRSISGRNRTSSIGEGSISGRLSKATERLRSASRNRKDIRHLISPPFEAPYESVAMPSGLHRSEMI